MTKKFASGGMIENPKDDDSILVMLSHGSYEVSPEVFTKYGRDLLDILNRMDCQLIVRGAKDADQSS